MYNKIIHKIVCKLIVMYILQLTKAAIIQCIEIIESNLILLHYNSFLIVLFNNVLVSQTSYTVSIVNEGTYSFLHQLLILFILVVKVTSVVTIRVNSKH